MFDWFISSQPGGIMGATAVPKLLLADGVWIATALLHRENPDRTDFTENEIQARFLDEGFPRGTHSNSLPAHISSHCVANKPRSRKKNQPSKLQGGAYRILFETRPGFRRLFHFGDDVHPDRIQPRRPSKTTPRREEIPPEYQPLLDWYKDWQPNKTSEENHAPWEEDPLIRLIGSGKHIWADEHADEYVENLRREDI
jgi:hypothetical protein